MKSPNEDTLRTIVIAIFFGITWWFEGFLMAITLLIAGLLAGLFVVIFFNLIIKIFKL